MNRNLRSVIFLAAASSGLWSSVWPPAVAQAAWNGWVQCVLSSKEAAPPYQNTEYHTWYVAGTRNAFGYHTGSWALAGRGFSVRTGSAWTFSGESAGLQLEITLNAAMLSIVKRHAQLADPNAILFSTGVAGSWTEWDSVFPINGTVQGPATNRTLQGSRTVTRTRLWMPQQQTPSFNESCSWSFADGSTPNAPSPAPRYVAGDFNGDGRGDVTFHRPVSNAGWAMVPVLESDGDGTWTAFANAAPTWAHQPGVVAIEGNYNSDGRADVAFHRPTSGAGWSAVRMLLSNGNGTWTERTIAAPTWAHEPGVVAIGGDYNRDGLSDLAFHRPGSGWTSVRVLLSTANGSWTAHSEVAPRWAQQRGVVAVAGDFNGDGLSDLAFHRPGSGWTSVRVLLSRGNGSWTAHSEVAPRWAQQRGVVAVAGDFNGDRLTDVAFHSPVSACTGRGCPRRWTTVPVLLANGDGTWTVADNAAPTWANAPGVVALEGDFNGDGLSDLAFHRPTGGAGWTTVPVLLANGDGSWTATDSEAPTAVHEPGVVAILGDFNG
ncbi:MAG: FG-GAP repeat domain-containing protein, partial [Geminicoccaceae bacterium]